jgi:hypothetical protein
VTLSFGIQALTNRPSTWTLHHCGLHPEASPVPNPELRGSRQQVSAWKGNAEYPPACPVSLLRPPPLRGAGNAGCRGKGRDFAWRKL